MLSFAGRRQPQDAAHDTQSLSLQTLTDVEFVIIEGFDECLNLLDLEFCI